MADFVNILSAKGDFVSLRGTTTADINAAEQELQVRFTKEYRKFLMVCGIASAAGHEFVGICGSPRMGVVAVTNAARIANPHVSTDWYVVEQTNIDGITIWQAPDGGVYQVAGGRVKRLCNSLSEYID